MFSAMDLINLTRKLRSENRLTEEESLMITSMIAQYINLEIKLEEYKFKLNEKG
jgi:hypothetical protein